MSAAILALAAVPVVAVASGAVGDGGNPAAAVPAKTAPNGGVQISAPSSGSSVKPNFAKAGLSLRGMVIGKTPGTTLTKSDIGYVAPVRPVSQTNPIDPALQQKLDEISGYAEAAYNNISDEAKKKAAAELNEQLKLDPPLKGDESWNDLSKVVGGAVGAAALGWIPGGQVLGPIIGAYLGGKLESLIAGNIDDAKAWFKSKWGDIESWVKGTASDVEDGVSDVIDYIGGWF